MIKGLFCGVSQYRSAHALPFCQNDVLVLKKTFTDNFIVDNDDIEIIADNGEIDNIEFIKKLKEFCEKCEKEDLAVVYYTGHGGVDERGDNFLCTTNTFNEYTCIYFDQLIHVFSQSKAKSKLVVLDCCHADNKYGTSVQTFNTEKAIDDLYQAGISVFCSCEGGQSSNPYYDKKVSAFTQFLSDALNYKGIYREDGIYFNDIKLLVETYAKVWNHKNVDAIQNPVFRSNMIGTIVFPLKQPKIKEKRKMYSIYTNHFDIIDLNWEIKSPKQRYQKIYSAKIIANADIENDVIKFVNEAVQIIKNIPLSAITQKQKLTAKQPVDVVLLWIGEDTLDVEEGYYRYRAVWEHGKELYWCGNLGNKRIQNGNIGYLENENYKQLKQDRLLYVYPDDELKKFWSENIKTLVINTELVISKFRDYENEELSFEKVQEEAQNVRYRLKDVYEMSFRAWFSLPGSKLKKFSDLSYDLAVLLREILQLFATDKGDQYIISNYKIKLAEYYQELNKWKINNE